MTRIAMSVHFAGLLLAVAPCAVAADEGRYLLITSQAAGRVVIEIDTGQGGMASCADQVAAASRDRPAGVVYRCSPTPSQGPLPYSFVAHQQPGELKGAKPSAPYRVRVADPARCALVRDTTRTSNTVILEDRCK